MMNVVIRDITCLDRGLKELFDKVVDFVVKLFHAGIKLFLRIVLNEFRIKVCASYWGRLPWLRPLLIEHLKEVVTKLYRFEILN